MTLTLMVASTSEEGTVISPSFSYVQVSLNISSTGIVIKLLKTELVVI